MTHVPDFPAGESDDWFVDMHGDHEVFVRTWYDSHYVIETGLTVDCDTCGMELACFDKDTPVEAP